MRYLLILLCSILSTGTFAQSDKALADSLATLVITDQRAASLPPEGIALNSPKWIAFKDSVFTAHYAILQSIFQRKGYPGYDMVGEKGSNNFWLLVQHLDKWPEFQEQVLQAMEKEMARNNASSRNFAYLTDRVRLNTNRKQVYGTQATYNGDSCQAIPKPLENPSSVNTRRKEVGLEPIEKYLNQLSESHFLMNREVYEKKGLKGPKLYPVTN